MPPRAITVMQGTTTYYYSGGVFYAKHGAGFIVLNTPIGVIVPQPPAAAQQVQVNGELYLLYNGIYFKPAFQNGVTVYTTVKL